MISNRLEEVRGFVGDVDEALHAGRRWRLRIIERTWLGVSLVYDGSSATMRDHYQASSSDMTEWAFRRGLAIGKLVWAVPGRLLGGSLKIAILKHAWSALYH